MGNKSQKRMRTAAAGLGLLSLMGCASAAVTSTRQYVSERDIPRPSVVLVYDFAVSASDVVVDTLGPEFSGGRGDHSERDQLGREVSNALAEALVAKLRERGIEAERAGRDSSPPLHAILLKGQFLTVDEGDRTKRMVIGLGAGSSELNVRVQVYQATERGLRRLSEGEAEASGSKMPGMAIPVGTGAAAGRAATSAVISGGMSVTREIRGSLGADAERLAEAIADRAEAFYQRRGWL